MPAWCLRKETPSRFMTTGDSDEPLDLQGLRLPSQGDPVSFLLVLLCLSQFISLPVPTGCSCPIPMPFAQLLPVPNSSQYLGDRLSEMVLAPSAISSRETVKDSSICDQHLPRQARAEMAICLGPLSAGIATASSGKKK